MKFTISDLAPLLNLLQPVLSATELQLIAKVQSDDFVFAAQLRIADSVHFHIHVPDVESLPHHSFINLHAVVENRKEGYIKYGLPGDIKIIFSHIPVAQVEYLTKDAQDAYLDHVGIDIRCDSKEAYIIFQQIPQIAAQQDLLFKRQGDGVEVVKCCHMQVKEKYWVYAGEHVNYEFAFGPLVIHDNGFGIDLRPANPFNKPVEMVNQSCCEEQPKLKIFV